MTTAALWTLHRPLARQVASRFQIPGADRDDVVQEATIALWEAARMFDPERGASFRTFANRVIENHLGDCVRVARRPGKMLLTEAEPENFAELPHLHQVFDRVETREEITTLLRAIRDELTPLQRHCVLGIASGLSYLEIGEPAKVDKNAAKARAKLRRVLCG